MNTENYWQNIKLNLMKSISCEMVQPLRGCEGECFLLSAFHAVSSAFYAELPAFHAGLIKLIPSGLDEWGNKMRS